MKPRPRTTERMDWERPSERFLAYLERLSEACLARDGATIDKLMRLRLSSHVPRAVLDELEFFRRGGKREGNLRAPMKLMRYVHQMKQLATAPADEEQFPLELREREITAPVEATPRRVRERGRGKGE
jgi:hypothetical protein